ncbi:MAG TPA: hypothetical protein VMU79_06230, partial [Casimicrobiaceae bacterium]|nr:hypothetical protein [Casimicrobiaceae bacterium]
VDHQPHDQRHEHFPAVLQLRLPTPDAAALALLYAEVAGAIPRAQHLQEERRNLRVPSRAGPNGPLNQKSLSPREWHC